MAALIIQQAEREMLFSSIFHDFRRNNDAAATLLLLLLLLLALGYCYFCAFQLGQSNWFVIAFVIRGIYNIAFAAIGHREILTFVLNNEFNLSIYNWMVH